MKRPSAIPPIIFLLLLTQCREITTTTKIDRDGSCERTIEVAYKDDDLAKSAFPIPMDSTWKSERFRDRKDSSRTVYRAQKRFESFQDLTREYAAKPDSLLRVHLDLQLQKKFRWFYTFFEYREVYKAYNPFHYAPISDYMTPEEWQRYVSEKDTTGLKKKYDDWSERSLMEEIFQPMKSAAKALNIPGLPDTLLERKKQALFTAFKVSDAEPKTDEVLRVCEQVLGKPVWQLRAAVDRALIDLNKKMEYASDVESNSYVNKVMMPGLLISSNAPQLQGNTAMWEIHEKEFCINDFIMQAESRVVNLWAVAVTALAALVSLAAWAVMFWRSRRIRETS